MWVVDVAAAVIEHYAEPAETAYRRVDRFERGDVVRSLALPGLSVSVDDVPR